MTPRAATLVVAAAGVLLIGTAGPAAGVALGVVLAVSLGLRSAAARRRQSAHVAAGFDLALGLELLGAAMACGAMPSAALLAVARALPGPAADRLAEAATRLALGADPQLVWSQLAASLPALAPAARVCARASTTGAAVADELFRLAAAARTDRQVRRRRQLQRAGVWLVLPLGTCFLPAFVLVAVVPVVLAAAPALLR